MPTRQLRLHTTFLKTFLNDLQLFVIRPMTTPSFGVGNGLLAGVGFVAAHDCKRYKISHHPKRRPSPDAYTCPPPRQQHYYLHSNFNAMENGAATQWSLLDGLDNTRQQD